MEGIVKQPRPYSSPVRAEQARRTRARVLESARELFVAQGYAATTIAAVARHAGVSPDTVYTAFGTKAQLVKELLDVVIGGDDADVPLLEREGPQRVRAETDQRVQFAMFAEGITEQLERTRPVDDILRGAAAVDASAAALREDLQLRQRRHAMRMVVSWIAANGPLWVAEDEAAAIVWTLTSSEVHHMMREVWGWSKERYVEWLRDTFIATLLPDVAPVTPAESSEKPPSARRKV